MIDALASAKAKLQAQGLIPSEVRMTTAMREQLRKEAPSMDFNGTHAYGLRIVIDDTATQGAL